MNLDVQTLVKKYEAAIERKEALMAKKQEMLAAILNDEDEGRTTDKNRQALKALVNKQDLAEARVEKAKENLKNYIHDLVDDRLEKLADELQKFDKKIKGQVSTAGKNLGAARRLFQSLGPSYADAAKHVHEIVEAVKIGGTDALTFLEGYSGAYNEMKPENLHVTRQELKKLQAISTDPLERERYESKAFFRALKGDF